MAFVGTTLFIAVPLATTALKREFDDGQTQQQREKA
jgi:hypothetical protein